MVHSLVGDTMRQISLFFLVSAFAVSAIAQPAPSGAPAAPTTDTGLTADGKIKLGYEGRGNYRKPKTGVKSALPTLGQANPIADTAGIPTARNPAIPANAQRTMPRAQPVQIPATAQASTEITQQVRKLSSDSNLGSDMDKIRARREAAAKAREVPIPAAAPAALPANNPITNNGLPALPIPPEPMRLVGGQIVQ
jgi:hypothetical protein